MTLDSLTSARQETILPSLTIVLERSVYFLSHLLFTFSDFVSLCPIAHYEASTQGDILSQPPHTGRLQLEAILLSWMTLVLVLETDTAIS